MRQCLTILLAAVLHATAVRAADTSLTIEPGAGTQIQEVVISVSDIERAMPAFRDVLQWKVLQTGPAHATVARSWGLPGKTRVNEVLLGNAASRYGYIRLVKIADVPQQPIRPMGRWWDTGGMYNVNVLVKDLDAVEAGLAKHGWHAVSLVDEYEYPGNVRGRSQIMVGPESVVLSFQQRIAPALSGWPDFAGAAHIETGYQIVTDFDKANDFWKNIMGLTTREPRLRKSDKPVGQNDYGLPHNLIGVEDSRQGGAYPRKGGEQLIGLRQFVSATGFDFTERARPPNLGIMTLRLPFADIDPILTRARAAGMTLAAEPQIVEMAPYGKARLAALRAPGSGLWVEIFEPGVQPLSHDSMQSLLGRGAKGTWVSFGGGARGTMSYARGGKANVTWEKGGVQGTWALKGNTICTAWPSMRDGREQCAVYFQVDGRSYQSFQVDGTPDGFNTFQ